MGAKVPVVSEAEEPPDVLFIDENLRGNNKGFGFSRLMFSKKEWRTLKKFCIANGIAQLDLNRMYNRYLANDAAVVRNMRILLADVSGQFSDKSPVYKDIMQILCPTIFLREYDGLKPPYSNMEISFARCIIIGYTFCLQPISDLVYDFFSISRRSSVQLSATVFAYNLKQCVSIFCSELKPSATRRFVIEKCIRDDDEEISILSIMQIGLKYPLLFFQLYLFQKHFRRLIFGDVFWKGRKIFPSRFGGIGIVHDECVFLSEKDAIRETARQILYDFATEATESPRLYWEQKVNVTELTIQACTRAKHSLGYRWARSLIEESELEYPCDQCFADVPSDYDDEVRLYDNQIKSDFVYNVGTGYRAWVEQHKLRDGEVVKELWHRTNGSL